MVACKVIVFITRFKKTRQLVQKVYEDKQIDFINLVK